MSTVLQIRSVRIKTTTGWEEPYNLDVPVVAIVGPVDTGKSTLLDCIAFGLGRDIHAWRGVVDTHLVAVDVGIRIGSGTFVLRRTRRTSSHVEVLDASGTMIDRYGTRQQPGAPTISEWLLQQLELDNTFASARLPGSKMIDFASALLSYCYLTQTGIDQYIIRPSRDDAARLVTLQLLLNLTTPEYQRMDATIRDTDNEIDRRRKRANTISDFLADSQATHPDVLADRIAQLKAREREADKRLETLRTSVRIADQASEQHKQNNESARNEVADAEDALDKARRRLRTINNTLNGIKESLQALDELEHRSLNTEPPTLHGIIPTCLACNADITDRRVEPGCCYLCCQPLSGARHITQRKRLQLDYQQAASQLDSHEKEVHAASIRATKANQVLTQLRQQWDANSRDAVAPYLDDVAAATGELAEIRQELASLARVKDAHDRLVEQYQQIDELETEQQQRRKNHILIQGQLESSDEVLARLNEIFCRVIDAISLPHATGHARLDAETLLPLVDEQTFDQRGGGARSAVAVAYSLALLTYTLENPLANLPGLLIIDSPQKNFGANPHDKALAHRVYERFLDYMQERSKMADGRFHRPYQLIIVDNDLHPDIRTRIMVHDFKRDSGFIRNLTDLPNQMQLDFGDL